MSLQKTYPRLYNAWANMKKRCSNPRVHNYNRYGGRGISVCDEWQSSKPFIIWALNNGYADDLTIDRIDNDGNYEPSNCRWVSPEENAANKTAKYNQGEDHARSKLSVEQVREIRASTDSYTECAKRFGVSKSTIQWIRKRWSWKHVA